MHACTKAVNFIMVGKKNKKWSCGEFWLTKKQVENMAMNSLSEPMRVHSAVTKEITGEHDACQHKEI